jgi:malate dehydrogenase (oxaloacetate-decarboxylating)
LLTAETANLSPAQQAYAKSDWDADSSKGRGLLEVIREVKPNVLVGTSTKPQAFTEDIVREMARHVDRPIILPLSNPTRLHEAVPADLLRWTGGRALVATGSPFPPVRGPWGPGGHDIEITAGECNNSVVFPGIGLGAVLCRASRLTDKMLVAAVQGVVAMSPALRQQEKKKNKKKDDKKTDDQAEDQNDDDDDNDEVDTAPLVPGVDDVRAVSARIACEVIRAAVAEGVATEEGIPEAEDELDAWVKEQMWDPIYRPLRRVEAKGASRKAKAQLKVVGSLVSVE